MDYLYRDSLHCGVPYGMNFDAPRLINSICLNEAGDGIAISSKGKTAAEMMVFARYVMFSEVYWHHAVRSATAMLQRACHRLAVTGKLSFNMEELATWDESNFGRDGLLTSDENVPGRALFGTHRCLYKRLLDFTADEDPEIYQAFAHRPYPWLRKAGAQLAQRMEAVAARPIHEDEVLIDAPPTGLEVQFKVAVRDQWRFRQLEEISPVVKALAQRQFDDFVKKIRVFVHPQLAGIFTTEQIRIWLTDIASE